MGALRGLPNLSSATLASYPFFAFPEAALSARLSGTFPGCCEDASRAAFLRFGIVLVARKGQPSTCQRDDADKFTMPAERFDNADYIEQRVAAAQPEHAGQWRTALRYLYQTNGPTNLPRDQLMAARAYFDGVEDVVIPWLYTRTNGSLRRSYG